MKITAQPVFKSTLATVRAEAGGWRVDALICICLVALALIYTRAFFDFSRFPSEDAAMLMRYSAHLAAGQGWVWNIGEPPLDGATDFLLVIVLAALQRAGLSPERAVHATCYFAHICTILLVYVGSRRFFGAPRWAALISAAFLAVGLGTLYTEAYFGTAFFAFLMCATWFVAIPAARGDPGHMRSLAFALVAFMTALGRPEGLLYSTFVLCALLYANGWRSARRTTLYFFGVFALAGTAYLLWRVSYFGDPLPNPFYAKGGGHLHTQSLRISVGNTLFLSFPFILALAYGLVTVGLSWFTTEDRAVRCVRAFGVAFLLLFGLALLHASDPSMHAQLVLGRYSSKYTWIMGILLVSGALGMLGAGIIGRALHRLVDGVLSALGTSQSTREYLRVTAHGTVFVLIPVGGFVASWILIRDENNYLMRFQYPILPVILMSWPLILWRSEPETGYSVARKRFAAVVAMAFVAAVGVCAVRQHVRFEGAKHHRDSRYDVAIKLREYGTDHTIATTEAGLLPFYSGWRAIDLFGLNDRVIARAGSFDDEYLANYHPDVIMLATTLPVNMTPTLNEGSHAKLLRHAKRYAETHGFTLAAAYGADRTKVHYYYVSDAFAGRDDLVAAIRGMTYTWYRDGSLSVDYTNETVSGMRMPR
ncbi:MAG TPA: hypothetical protein VFX92_05220 [Candidatus Krumholzibacteria bacterium]|nr:hypothetical protein [Candidatus Krumholzibacteria bacterium]